MRFEWSDLLLYLFIAPHVPEQRLVGVLAVRGEGHLTGSHLVVEREGLGSDHVVLVLHGV